MPYNEKIIPMKGSTMFKNALALPIRFVANIKARIEQQRTLVNIMTD